MLNVIAGLILLGSPSPSEPPTDAEVLRAMPPVSRGIPRVCEEYRNDITIVKNLLRARTLTVPLFGEASVKVVEDHWECVVYYNRVIRSDFPFPVTVQKPRAMVLYFDKLKPAN